MTKFKLFLILTLCANTYFVKSDKVVEAKDDRRIIKPSDCLCVSIYECNNKTEASNINSHGNTCQSSEICCNTQDLKLLDVASLPSFNRKKRLPNLKVNKTSSTANKTISAVTKTISVVDKAIRPCGSRNVKSVPESGFNVSATEFPWSVTIYYNYSSGRSEKLCMGTLIDRQVVLTAADCILGNNQLRMTVRAGKWNEQINESLPLQYRRVQMIEVHPKYKRNPYLYNVALIKLTQPFGYADNVNEVCIFEELYDWDNCIAPAYNLYHHGPTEHRLVKLSILDILECQSALDDSVIGQDFILYTEFTCAKKIDENNICLADIGNPLVCPTMLDPTRYTLVGVLFWDVDCNTQAVSGIYTDIFEMREWTEETLSFFKGNPKRPSQKTKPKEEENGEEEDDTDMSSRSLKYYEYKTTGQE